MPATITPSTDTQRRRELPLPVRAWVRLMRVFHRIDRQQADHFRRWNLSVGRFDVINHAGLHEDATQQELADALLVTKGNISQLLDALEREGLLCRTRAGRCSRVHLTAAGRDLRETVMIDHIETITTAMSALDDDEQRTLLILLRKVERGLDAHGAPDCPESTPRP